MVNMTSASTSGKAQKSQSVHPGPSIDQLHSASRNSVLMDEYSEEDEEYQIPDLDQEVKIVEAHNSVIHILT